MPKHVPPKASNRQGILPADLESVIDDAVMAGDAARIKRLIYTIITGYALLVEEHEVVDAILQWRDTISGIAFSNDEEGLKGQDI